MLAVTQDEIETLYSRFRILDRSSKVRLFGSCVGIFMRQPHSRGAEPAASGTRSEVERSTRKMLFD